MGFSEFQTQFYNRINLKIPIDGVVRFEDIENIMKSCSETFTFENIDLINNQVKIISKESMNQELLLNNKSSSGSSNCIGNGSDSGIGINSNSSSSGSGGLCYKLNGLFYYFLLECGFNVQLSLGTVIVGLNPWGSLNNHVVIILNHNSNNYLIDIGFASYLSLSPILINNNSYQNHNNNNNNNSSSSSSSSNHNHNNNNIITNKNGLFKIINEINSGIYNSTGELYQYTHTFQFRKDDGYLIESDRNWVSCYVFNLNKVNDENECLNIIQNQIIRDKLAVAISPLAVKYINDIGLATLTINNLTITNYNGMKTITTLNSIQHFNQLLFNIFNINNSIQSLNK